MTHWVQSYILLLRWTTLKLRTDIPIFICIQALMSIGIIVGFSLLIPSLNDESALYLASGAITFSLISIGIGVAPQVINVHKVQGLLDFERTIPVPRLAILAADLTSWLGIALPGIVLTIIAAHVRFDISLSISPLVVPAAILVSISAAMIGYGVVYSASPVMVALIGNMVMITALMFSPINYPSHRLPQWALEVHTWLPFQYMAEVIRNTISSSTTEISIRPFIILVTWSAIGLLITSRAMTARS